MSTPPRQNLRTLVIGLVAIALLIGVYALTSALRGLVHAPRGEIIAAADRREAPALVWKDLDGKDWKLSGQRGHVVVLNYFATWCEPCLEELPDLGTLAKEYEPRGAVFAAISIDKEEEMGKPLAPALKAFAADNHLAVPVLLAHAPTSLTEPRGVPTTFLIDRQGRLALVIAGKFEIGEMRDALDKLLAEK